MTYKHAISWFEIPVKDLSRAQAFYERAFEMKMISLETPQLKMRLFPLEDPMGVGGALVDSGGFHTPSDKAGPLIYLNANPDLQPVLERMEAAGARILVKKTQISPEYGFMAAFIDPEGNRIALHSIS